MKDSKQMIRRGLYSLVTLPVLAGLASCQPGHQDEKPNVVLIMADDMGYECLSVNGSLSYRTPVLDSLANQGIRFTECISQPLCTPSRVKIMTGMYNYRNYEYFGYLNDNQYTFGQLMKEAGYATCIAGKWQLNGLAYTKRIPDWQDSMRPGRFGFDEYCLWQLTKNARLGGRYADPLIQQNGRVLNLPPGSYGPDIFSRFVLDFVDRHRDEPFFVYYPMVLVHNPFVPTPDSPEWADPAKRHKRSTLNFRDMVEYADRIVGQITAKLKELELDQRTLLIFTGDNGTNVHIRTQMTDRWIRGGKGNTIDAGTHVPLIAYWPEKIRSGSDFNKLIEFSDFLPTLAELTGQTVQCDGHSFYPLLVGKKFRPRETVFVHYDPRWGAGVNKYRNRFTRTVTYKLYQDGRFFYLPTDFLEQEPLDTGALTTAERKIRIKLQKEIDKAPPWK